MRQDPALWLPRQSALGTILAELAGSIMKALKNERDLAIGNLTGSDLWDLLAVLVVPGLLVS